MPRKVSHTFIVISRIIFLPYFAVEFTINENGSTIIASINDHHACVAGVDAASTLFDDAIISSPKCSENMTRAQSSPMQEPTRCTADRRTHEDHESESPVRGPYFDVSASHNVTALVGKTATLNCRVRNLGDRTVSWVRHRDIHLLTVGVETYTSDQRFVASHLPHTEDWTLQVKYPQRRDSGTYECQVSTAPPIGHSMLLSVVEPVTIVIGEPEMYINRESTMNLTCVVRHSPEPPANIQWTHNHKVINYDSPRGGVSVITEKGEVTTSYLLIQRAQPADSGQYTCHPSNANTKTVLVHVLNGEHPAAMQHGGQLKLANLPFVMISTTLLTFLNHPY